ncbi:glycosyltransferase family 25 protein [Vibrio sinaloensis]|uniref:glycosyltransferase family 25 protein n=1 Tax=Photobacterium sp. (strain ATCC 43367) TaxID=379097 RepID=UPI002068F3A0|nr:glycosyltransferase family 25 protein [Vibrio sinaloensis]UPQ88099.1 glycosyltransferase family 25 protein [Vibrio sinaloensis]
MKIYVISLKRSPERRENIKKQLDTLGLEFEFFDAVDGRAEPPHPLFARYDYNKRLWLTSGRMPSKGELGCYASHYLLWQKCVDLNAPILIIEDDSDVQPRIKELLPLIEAKTIEYGFLRLEPETEKCALYEKESSDSYSIYFMSDNFGGTRSYAICPQSAKKLVSGSERWCMPVDNYIGSLYLHNMPSYLLKPFIVENPEEFGTTIQLGEEEKAKWYRKPTRELYSLYRKISMSLANNKYK